MNLTRIAKKVIRMGKYLCNFEAQHSVGKTYAKIFFNCFMSSVLTFLLFFAGFWYLSIFCQSFFHHRYASHKAFEMSNFWEKFFWILSYIAHGPGYLSPYAYAVMHRMHHAYTDREDDPHAPKFVKGGLWGLWHHTRRYYSKLSQHKVEVDPRFTKNVPTWHSADQFFISDFSIISWMVIVAGFYTAMIFYFNVFPVWSYAFLPLHLLLPSIHGLMVNYFGHIIGYKNFKQNNDSRNVLPFDFLLVGELYHHNHHQRPSAYNFGVKFFELDLLSWVIRLFDLVGIVRIRQKQEKPVVAKSATNPELKEVKPAPTPVASHTL